MPDSFESQVSRIETLLRQVGVVIRKRGREILADTGVTPPQLDALCHLREQPLLTMGELGQRMGLACSTATDLCDRMERNGLIVRERDRVDRRVIRLRITSRGEDVIDQVIAARKRYLSGVLRLVSAEERRQLIASLVHLADLMHRAQPAPQAERRTGTT